MNIGQILSRIPLFFDYWMRQVDQHSLHSPYLFSLYHYLQQNRSNKAIHTIEEERRSLRKSPEVIEITNFGAKSSLGPKSSTVSAIASYGVSASTTSMLLVHLATFHQSKSILELGTSLGLNTAYLATIPESSVYTVEGNKVLSDMAAKLNLKLGNENVEYVCDEMDNALDEFAVRKMKFDMVFVDANHRGEAILRYFTKLKELTYSHSIIVFDDIRWSMDMYKGWKNILRRDEVRLAIDFGNLGMVSFNPDINHEKIVMANPLLR